MKPFRFNDLQGRKLRDWIKSRQCVSTRRLHRWDSNGYCTWCYKRRKPGENEANVLWRLKVITAMKVIAANAPTPDPKDVVSSGLDITGTGGGDKMISLPLNLTVWVIEILHVDSNAWVPYCSYLDEPFARNRLEVMQKTPSQFRLVEYERKKSSE